MEALRRPLSLDEARDGQTIELLIQGWRKRHDKPSKVTARLAVLRDHLAAHTALYTAAACHEALSYIREVKTSDSVEDAAMADIRMRVAARLMELAHEIRPFRLPAVVSVLGRLGMHAAAEALFRSALPHVRARIAAAPPALALEMTRRILHVPLEMRAQVGTEAVVERIAAVTSVVPSLSGEDLARVVVATADVGEAFGYQVDPHPMTFARAVLRRAAQVAADLSPMQMGEILALVDRARDDDESKRRAVVLVRALVPVARAKAEEFEASDVAKLLDPLGLLSLDEATTRHIVDLTKLLVPRAKDASRMEAVLILNRLGKLPLDEEARAIGARYLKKVMRRLPVRLDAFLIAGLLNAIGQLAVDDEARVLARPLVERLLKRAVHEARSSGAPTIRGICNGLRLLGWSLDEKVKALLDGWAPAFGCPRGQSARDIVQALVTWGVSLHSELLLGMVADRARRDAVARIQVGMRSGKLPEELVAGLPCLVSDLEAAGVANIDAWLSEARQRTADADAYKDLWFEGHFAVALSRNRFRLTLKPFPGGGPDLLAAVQSKEICVEVRTLPQSLHAASGVRQLAVAILGKHWQHESVPPESAYLVLARSPATVAVNLDLENVMRELQEEARGGGARYEHIGAVLFDDGWPNATGSRRWSLWPNPSALPARRIPQGLVPVLQDLSLPPPDPRVVVPQEGLVLHRRCWT